VAFGFCVLAVFSGPGEAVGQVPGPKFAELSRGIEYANERVPRMPWSIHVVRVDRNDPALAVQSVHSHGAAVGLSTLSDQLREVRPTLGVPIAAINGDFYQRGRLFAGDPRGLQVVGGELLSAPEGGVAFWIDAAGEPHAENVTPHFEVTWPDGSKTPFGLNGERAGESLELYTPAIGASTRAMGGREWVLEPANEKGWPPLAIDQEFSAKVRGIHEAGDAPVPPGTMVLSASPGRARRLPRLAVGAVLKFSTATSPSLRGATAAIGGGPLLVHAGKALKIRPPSTDAYEYSSMFERHPRTGFGWSRRYYFLLVVDGRQDGLSIGMTLEELGAYLARLGCEEAMNLDGGGSSTLWAVGRVRNSPCDGRERPLANGVVVLRKPASAAPAKPN
jgi:hypothetical protein